MGQGALTASRARSCAGTHTHTHRALPARWRRPRRCVTVPALIGTIELHAGKRWKALEPAWGVQRSSWLGVLQRALVHHVLACRACMNTRMCASPGEQGHGLWPALVQGLGGLDDDGPHAQHGHGHAGLLAHSAGVDCERSRGTRGGTGSARSRLAHKRAAMHGLAPTAAMGPNPHAGAIAGARNIIGSTICREHAAPFRPVTLQEQRGPA